MNFKTDLSNSNQELLSQIGIEIEDRNSHYEQKFKKYGFGKRKC